MKEFLNNHGGRFVNALCLIGIIAILGMLIPDLRTSTPEPEQPPPGATWDWDTGDIVRAIFDCAGGDCGNVTASGNDTLDFSSLVPALAYIGLIIPQGTDCGNATGAGQLCYDTDDKTLYSGDGTSAVAITGGGGSGGGDIYAVGDCATGNCFVEAGNGTKFYFEGSTADGNETAFSVIDPTADRTINLPDASGNVTLNSQWDTEAEMEAMWGVDILTSGNNTDGLSEGSTNLYMTEEDVEDYIGAGMSGNTETRITVTYQDGDGTFDFVVDDMNDDVPDAGDFGAATDLDANGEVADDSHAHVITNIDSFTKANLETQTSDVADYAEADGDTWTGAHDAGGVTTWEQPNAADPTTTNAGDLAIDTDDEFIEIMTGNGTARCLPALQSATMILGNPEDWQAVEDAWPIKNVTSTQFPHGITVVNCYVWVDANAHYTIMLEEWTAPETASADITAVGTEGTTEGGGPVPPTLIEAGNYVFVDLPTTDVNFVGIKIEYYVVAGN